MILEFNKFPKIHQVGARHVRAIFDDVVEITEKVDGSQLAFGILGGELRIRSRGAVLVNDAPDQMFAAAVASILERQDRLIPDCVYYGEYLRCSKHNVLCYERIPAGNVALFGMFSSVNGTWVQEHAKLQGVADHLDLGVVPLIFSGVVKDVSILKGLLERESMLGGPNVEGVVIKNYARRYMLGDQEMTLMAAKYVSEEFKEVAGRTWKREHTGKGRFDVLKESYRSPARWMKAVQRLREAGTLAGEPRDIGELIKSVKLDIQEEEQEEIKEALYGIFRDDILRVSVSGLAQWYKERLLEGAFTEEEEEVHAAVE